MNPSDKNKAYWEKELRHLIENKEEYIDDSCVRIFGEITEENRLFIESEFDQLIIAYIRWIKKEFPE